MATRARNRRLGALCAVAAALVLAQGCGDTKGKSCCDCLIENGCWMVGSGITYCPTSSCYCVYAPAYGTSCKPDGENCVGYGSACYQSNCVSACEGVQGF